MAVLDYCRNHQTNVVGKSNLEITYVGCVHVALGQFTRCSGSRQVGYNVISGIFNGVCRLHEVQEPYRHIEIRRYRHICLHPFKYVNKPTGQKEGLKGDQDPGLDPMLKTFLDVWHAFAFRGTVANIAQGS